MFSNMNKRYTQIDRLYTEEETVGDRKPSHTLQFGFFSDLKRKILAF